MANRKGGFIGQDGLNAPDQPTGVSASAGNTQATISFTAPSDVGGAAITGYSVQSDNGDGTARVNFDLENASYDSKSFSAASQATGAVDFYIRPDNGLKLYVTDGTTDSIYQYTLGTAWDISTASYDSVVFDASSQDTAPFGITFKPDGSKMYLAGSANDSVFEYDLSTPWDLSSTSYSGNSFSTASQETSPIAILFKPDGLKMYVGGPGSDAIYQYSLSTPWDVSSASYDSASIDLSAIDISIPRGAYFNPEGTELFLSGNSTDTIYQFNLSTAWDLSTATNSGISYSVTSEVVTASGLSFKTDGSKMYVMDGNGDTIHQYTTGNGLDYPTSSPVTVSGLTNGTSYTFNVWAINAFGWSSPSDASGSVTPFAPAAFFYGGSTSNNNVIESVAIASLGNTSDFGDLVATNYNGAACSSSTRGIVAGGNAGGAADTNVIQYFSLASSGNAADFGDLITAKNTFAGCSNSTRGVFGGEANNTIEYITIASTGNSLDFGDLITGSADELAALASSTRGVWGGGSGTINVIQYITLASLGNATDFGDLLSSKEKLCGLSSDTRGVFAGGASNGNVIQYITIASTGNATDFGDLTKNREDAGATSSLTRGLIAGGATDNTIDYITIASTGNAADFGDLLYNGFNFGVVGLSNAHGGLA